MFRTRSVIFAGIMLVLVVSIGTAGYMSIEGWSLLDALYMTVITISTV
jgi:voltage-gated potassium channel